MVGKAGHGSSGASVNGFWNTWFADGTVLTPDILLRPGQVEQTKELMEQPGSIDLSSSKFHATSTSAATSSSSSSSGSSSYNNVIPYNPTYNNGHHQEEEIAEADQEQLQLERSQQRYEEIQNEVTYIDIAIFPLPNICTMQHCDMSKFGIGVTEAYEGVQFNSLCHNGRLHIVHDYYNGFTTSLPVPAVGKMPKYIHNEYDKYYYVTQPNTYYGIIIANCANEKYGRDVHINGRLVFAYGDTPTTPHPPTFYDIVYIPKYLFTAIGVFLFLVSYFIKIQFPRATAPSSSQQRARMAAMTSSSSSPSANTNSSDGVQYQVVDTAEDLGDPIAGVVNDDNDDVDDLENWISTNIL